MKIFISHSSKDKWVARRISEDLISLGHKTFLDEKDIETGQSIDSSIQKHLKGCSDFLIIVSPASIKSDWVLIELGGAIALEKKIIPILLYVGTNEMPQVINLRLARDINAIQQYYDEIKKSNSAISTKKMVEKRIKKDLIETTYKVGDRVLVVPVKPKDAMRSDALIDWEPEMDAFLGQETEISYVSRRVSEGYNIKIDVQSFSRRFVFAKEWLIPIN